MAKRPTTATPARAPRPAPKPSPPLGEATKRQSCGTVVSLGGLNIGAGGECGRPDYATYRRMRKTPTVALVRAAACAPIKMAEWSVEADEGVPDDATELVQSVLTPLWADLMKNALYALDYGWSASELVWGLKDGATVIERVKPLWIDDTQPLVTTEHGRLVGVRQRGVDLLGAKAFTYTYDGEAENPFGRSRHENIRENAWAPWVATAKKQADYLAKVAGVIPIMHYPAGEQPDGANGQMRDNAETAAATLSNLHRGSGIAIPWDFPAWAETMLNRGIDPTQLVSWQVSFLETKGDHSGGFGNALRYYDSLICRGWLVPERAITEGQAGTKAEAEAHGDIAVAVAAETFGEIVQAINRQVVDPLIGTNYGPSLVGKLRVKGAPLVDADKAFVRQLVASILTAPGNAELLFATTDFDAMLDQARIPKLAEVVDAQEVRARAEAPQTNAPPAEPSRPDARALAASRSILLGVLDDIYRTGGRHGRTAKV